ncbi:MAG: ATP synthase F1 subunit delta [Acidobacteria bacterium CG_4_9_14_3_um_filter_49_7]|nr:MAG: ATP synthase F1 subunit delta [Acidobacteria bacterium CG_4_9_14_3_um_filter_49_7]
MAGREAINQYARAFVSIISKREDALTIFSEFRDVANGLTENTAVVHYFLNPSILTRDKVKMMDKLLIDVGADGIVRRLMTTLVKNNRFNILKFLLEPTRHMLYEELGMVEVKLTVPVALSKGMEARFQAAFEKRTGKQVVLSTQVDSGVIGGAVARIGSLLIDGSLKTNLVKMREKLTGEI